MKYSKFHPQVGQYFTYLLVIFFLSGCAPTIDNIKVEPVESYPAGNKIPLQVKLIITDEFRNYNPTLFRYGEGDVSIKLAEPFTTNTKKIDSEIFLKVIIHSPKTRRIS